MHGQHQQAQPAASGQTGLGRANNPHEAFRAILLLLAADPQYANASIGVVRSIDRSVSGDQYYLLLHEGKVLGAILWCEISAKTRDACVRENRAPKQDEALRSGDAIFVTAIAAISPEGLRLLWNLYADANRQRDLVYQRHFSDGSRPARVRMVRGGRPVRS